jgi:flagellar biogenesis protein FliO
MSFFTWVFLFVTIMLMVVYAMVLKRVSRKASAQRSPQSLELSAWERFSRLATWSF